MTRRLKSKTRKYAGNRTFGGGNTKNRRGKGSKGGRGRAGFHKHKWLRTAKYELDILRANHTGFHPVRGGPIIITLRKLNQIIANEKIEKKDGLVHFSFPNAKIIGSTPLIEKVHLIALSFSKGAKAAIEKNGGKAEAMPEKVKAYAEKTPPAKKEAKK